MRTNAYTLALYAMALSSSLVAAAPLPAGDANIPCVGDCANKIAANNVENNKPSVPSGSESSSNVPKMDVPGRGVGLSGAPKFDVPGRGVGLPGVPTFDVPGRGVPGGPNFEVPGGVPEPNNSGNSALPKPEVPVIPKTEVLDTIPKTEIPGSVPKPEVPAKSGSTDPKIELPANGNSAVAKAEGISKPVVPAGIPKPEVSTSEVPVNVDSLNPEVPAGIPRPEVSTSEVPVNVGSIPKPEVPAGLPKPEVPKPKVPSTSDATVPKPEVPGTGIPVVSKPEVPVDSNSAITKPEDVVPCVGECVKKIAGDKPVAPIGQAKDIKDKVNAAGVPFNDTELSAEDCKNGTVASIEHESEDGEEVEATLLNYSAESEVGDKDLDVDGAVKGVKDIKKGDHEGDVNAGTVEIKAEHDHDN